MPAWPVLLLSVDHSAYWAAALFVDALTRLGLRHACVTPGSRSTPLALACAEHPLVTDWVHHDERSSSFFALGIAKATRTPVAIVTTSGTAAAELLPAAVEARYAGVPLLLLTADRPPELRGIGSPQTVDQKGMFGTSVRTSVDVVLADMDPAAVEDLAVSVWGASTRRPPRPIHVNTAFREPLVPSSLEMPQASVEPMDPHAPIMDPAAIEMATSLLSGRKVLVVAGPIDEEAFPGAVHGLAERTGWPVVADPISQLRIDEQVIGTGDVLFGAKKLPGTPEAILRFGGTVTSKSLSIWLANHSEIPQIVIDAEGRDAQRSATLISRSDPTAFAQRLSVDPAPGGWVSLWEASDRLARSALTGSPFPSEAATVEAVFSTTPADSIVYVASSMPIRTVDRFVPTIRQRVLSNRGANGIDGLISSALGVAATGTRTIVITGDLSMLHDVGSLAAMSRFDPPMTVVVINNDGGGIFSFLPQSRLPRHFERVFATPHGLSFVPIAQAFGVPARRAGSIGDLIDALGEPGLVEVATDRDREVDVRRAALQRVTAALGS